MSFRQPQPPTIPEILKRSEDEIKRYVSRVFTSYPDKIITLKTKLNKHLIALNIVLINGEKIITHGLTGHAASKEEARRSLHSWADGTKKKELITNTARLNNA